MYNFQDLPLIKFLYSLHILVQLNIVSWFLHLMILNQVYLNLCLLLYLLTGFESQLLILNHLDVNPVIRLAKFSSFRLLLQISISTLQ
jgi:hypothetical protein